MKNSVLFCMLFSLVTACGAEHDEFEDDGLAAVEGEDEEDFEGDEPDEGGLGKADAVGSVEDNAGACSTRVVLGLSEQIIDEINCISPGSLVRVSGGGIVNSGSAMLPYFTAEAAAGLRAAARERSISIVSAYRTVAQQYLLRKWASRRRCGVRLAARPGRSNHESGRAIDVRNAGSMVSLMRRHGWHRTDEMLFPVCHYTSMIALPWHRTAPTKSNAVLLRLQQT